MALLLFLSMLGIVVAAVLEWPGLFAVACVTALVSLLPARGPSLGVRISFWLWTTGVLLLLLYPPFPWLGMPVGAGSWFGWPPAAFCMLAGIWLAPVAIWPLAFALGFGAWRNR